MFRSVAGKLLRTLTTIVIVALVTLLLAECALRASMLMSWNSPLYVADPQTGFRMRPGVASANETLNESGFNDVDHAANKSAGVVRLAIVGDSFVFGAVHRTANFTAVIQRLANASGEKLEVLNMGIPAAGPKNYLGLVGKDALERHADIVAVMLFMGNDVVQAHPDFDTRIWFGDVREVLVRPYALGKSMEYLSLYRTLRASARELTERLNDTHDGTFSRRSFLEVERQRAIVFEAAPSAFVRDSYASVIAITRQMMATATEHGIKLFVVLAPDELQVDSGLQAELMQSFGLNAQDYDFAGLSRNLCNDLEASRIPTLDLLPLFTHDPNSTRYLKQDTHWNEAGNALAGEAIWAFTTRRMLDRAPAPG